jgi:hypothetical protein
MFDVFCLSVALAVGQGAPADSQPIPPAASGHATLGDEPPSRIPPALPAVGVPDTWVPARTVSQVKPAEPKGPTPDSGPDKKPEEKKNGDEKKDEEKKDEKKEPEKGHFMKLIEGTPLGCKLEACKIKVDGWVDMSYTCSSRNTTNLPVTWNDRANAFLLQQAWVNIGKDVDTDSKEVDTGFKVAFLYGTDYRFTLIRGFFNNQLKNPNIDLSEPNGFEQNLYGFDIPLFYASVWLPGIGGEGTQVDIGRMFCQLGYESVMAPSSPLMSRSYAFQWAPPFFHMGIMATTKVDKNLTLKNMIANGNDVFFDGSQEARYMGAINWTSDDEKTTLALATSLGRGKFDASRPNGPAQGITTIGLAYEPFGRNNFNVFDLVYTQKIDDQFSVAFEAIYGYQQGVPAVATGSITNFNGTSGTCTWLSLVKYLNYNFSEQLGGILRLEAFYDAEGSRTGFEGWYWAGTAGLQFKPKDSIIFRPEIRYDYNGYSRPFEGEHGIFTAGADLIIKF